MDWSFRCGPPLRVLQLLAQQRVLALEAVEEHAHLSADCVA